MVKTSTIALIGISLITGFVLGRTLGVIRIPLVRQGQRVTLDVGVTNGGGI